MQVKLLRYQKDATYLFIDLETLNLCLNYCHNLPWQLSMLSVKGDIIQKEYDYLLKWDTELQISEDAARITRYDHQKVLEQGQDPKRIIEDIVIPNIESHDYIIGHNVLGFDINLIYEAYRFVGKDPKGIVDKFIDTNVIAKAIKIGFGAPKDCSLIEWQYKLLHKRVKGVKTNLKTIATELGIDFDENMLHDSLYDLRVNKKIWDALKYQIEI